MVAQTCLRMFGAGRGEFTSYIKRMKRIMEGKLVKMKDTVTGIPIYHGIHGRIKSIQLVRFL
jgi:hypothetical protein